MHNLEIQVAVLFGEVHVALENPVVIKYFDFVAIDLLLQLLVLLFLLFDHLGLPCY